MNLNKLNYEEVKILINEIKYFLGHVQLQIPTIGQYKKITDVKGEEHGIAYKFHVYRGIEENKYSMHLRFAENNIHLIRLCISGSKHHNSDGSVADFDHVHIYQTADNGKVEGYAYSLDNFPFDKDNSLAESVEKFLDYIKLRERSA